MSASLVHQKKNLVQSIKEAENSELQRMKKLAVTGLSGEKEVLLRRFEKERNNDQERIGNLTSDFFTLQDMVSKGGYRPAKENRSTAMVSVTYSTKPNPHHNRFVGLENRNEVIFYGDVCRKFNRHDEKFRQKSQRPVYNDTLEKHQLKLLGEKRDLLKQLVTIHVAERGGMGAQSSRTSRSNYSQSSQGSMSLRGSSRGSVHPSQASYASFYTGSLPMKAKQPANVPTLKLRGPTT
jgi:hypothetical protein